MSDSKDNQLEKYAEKVRRAKIVRKIVLISVAIIFFIFISALAFGYIYIKSALGPMDDESIEMVAVEIPIGSSSTQIGRILEDEGVIKNGLFFRYYVRYKNETGFQAGNYELSKAMTLDEIIDELKEGRMMQDADLVFTVPEGLWLVNVARIIAQNTDHEEETIIETLSDEEYLNKLIENYDVLTEDILTEGIRHPLEGYLFPARYDFLEEDVSIEVIIESMIERTDKVVTTYMGYYPDHPYSIHETLTLASIIEREAQKEEDRYKISGVLYNRLDRNMRLQVDPTVAYAIGEHLYMTSIAQTRVDSPYNTYMYAGIPIGPVANPGEASIKAAFEPEEIDYLYFYARYGGDVLYSKTYEEHNRIHQQYRHEWAEAAQSEESGEDE
ncbi:endolytic transglycosylase MltG [Alkalihalobacterium alkalinitrilicum]|uniref:endolytic transglycosylase MltG n=1 Tax=Alkalihalobacterium alkalinitrilicum TaxID=427920 RepID=UPI000994CF12|nr:endolytic transglycosylase MltG [Alkalihalobacterium alkalinitrilicum]